LIAKVGYLLFYEAFIHRIPKAKKISTRIYL